MPGRVRAAPLPWRYAALSLLASVLLALAYLALRDTAPIPAIEGQTLTWRFQLRGIEKPPPAAVILAIDDRSVARIGRFPLPRAQLGAAIHKLLASRAAAIGLDLLILDPEQPSNGIQPSADDQALIAALRSTDRAVLGLAFTFVPAPAPGEDAKRIAGSAAFRVVTRPNGIASGDVLRASEMRAPFSPLPGLAGLGHVNMPVEDDGTLRYVPAAIAFDDHYIPAFPVELVRRYMGLAPGDVTLGLGGQLIMSDRELALDRHHLRLPINYYGPAGTIPTFSLIDLLEDRVPASTIAGHVVLIGVTALGLGDNFVTPFSQTMPGVEVLATITDNLLAGQTLQRAGLKGQDLAAILILGLVAFALARLPLPFAAAGAAILLLLIWSVIATMALRHDLWLDMTFPAAAVLINAGGVMAIRARIERRMRRNLARYHSPVIVDMLAESATPRFEGSQDAAILFVDIAGFTGRIEKMAPEDTVRFLRDFHGRIERAMLAHGGVLEQFMGDGAMVVFGVPKPGPDSAAAALTAARDLFADIRQHNAELQAQGEVPFRISVGIHYGPVVVARLGGPTQAQLSTSGDTVNVASRLEKLTRDHGAAIAISGEVFEAVKAAGQGALLEGFELLATHGVRGREGRLAIWVRPEPTV